MTKIPKIIHQTWKDSEVPAYFLPLIETWKANHPDWEYLLWTDEMNRNFIKKYHIDFLLTYDSYPHNIQRVDAVRYFILYERGGVFIDMDFECLKTIEPLLKREDCVLGMEPIEHCDQHNKKMIICNTFMACTPKNEFFKEICRELHSNGYVVNNAIPPWLDILETTGPFKLTKIYDNYEEKDRIKILSSDTVYPITLKEARGLFTGKPKADNTLQKKINQAYAIHYFFGTWWEGVM